MQEPSGFSGALGQPISQDESAAANSWLNLGKEGWENSFNQFLVRRTFIAGTSLSRADEVVFLAVYPHVVEWKGKKLTSFPNFLRWFDLIQHLDEVKHHSLPIFAIVRPAPAFLAASPPAASSAPVQEAPQKEAPQKEAPKKEAPKKEAPKKEAPKKEAPQKEEPKKEETQKEAPKKEEPQKEQPPKGDQQQGKGKGKQAAAQPQAKGKGKQPAQPAQAAAPEGTDFSKLSIIVGQIKSAERHPDADSLYAEKIDLGEEAERSVVSGLVKHIGLDEFVGKKVLVLTNLKPAKMRGILSSGMVLCASTEEGLEVLSPPEGAKVGERLFVEGEEGPADAQLNPKKKIWDKVRDSGDFTVSPSGEIVYKGKPLLSSAGPVLSSKKLTGAKIA